MASGSAATWRRKTALIAAVVATACGAVAWRILTFAGFNNDHYIYLAGAQQVLLGEWPVRDFVDPGWPFMALLPALARGLFGKALIVEVMLVSGAFALGAACTVMAASRLSRSITIAVALAGLEILIGPRTFGYPKIALYALAGCVFTWYTARPTRTRLVAVAALTAVSFLFRHDHGLYIGLGALATTVAGRWPVGPRAALADGMRLAGLIALMLLPWVLFVQVQLGLVAYLRPALEFSRSEADATLMEGWPLLDASPTFSRENSAVLLFYLFHALPFVALPLAVWRLIQKKDAWVGESAAVVGIAVMALAMNLGLIRRPLVARIPDAVVPAMLLMAWLLPWKAGAGWRRAGRIAVASVAILASGRAVTSMASVGDELQRAGIVGRRGAFDSRIKDLSTRLRKTMPEGDQIPSRNALALQPFFGFVQRCTQPTDRIVMTGLSPDVFVLADRGFAGGQMAFRPNFYRGEADQRRALRRMARQSVPFFVLSLEEEAEFRQALGLIAAHMDAEYERMVDLPVPDQRGLRILVESGRRPSGVDAATGWPCFVPAGG